MCFSPIDIVNPSKYVSLKYRDRYIMQVPCGKCAACRSVKSNEWTYRLYNHALETFRSGGFVLFDTLTYDNVYLPHISDYIDIDSDLDFPCFSSRDLRLFVSDLRIRCKRKYKSNFSYFIASEYGTSENHLHRPHYHALFFVNGPIKFDQFSNLVSLVWYRGRTDGLPWKSALYVSNNVFFDMSAGAVRSLKYVCKYIQKDTSFQKQIDYRLDAIMKNISDRFVSQGLESWDSSSHYWRIRELISSKISQFHRQSTFLGASVLADIDLVELFKTGNLVMPDNEFVVRSIPLPMYFKRKLFYELVEVDGSKSWQPTELGLSYLSARKSVQLNKLKLKFDALKAQLKLDFDSSKLSDYVMNFRGRLSSFLSFDCESTLLERLQHIDFYNYSNRYDKEWFSRSGLSSRFLGNSSLGYKRGFCIFQPIADFIRKNVYFDKDSEDLLTKISDFRLSIDAGRQRLYEQKQRLSNIVHYCFA